MTVKELREQTGLSQQKFGDYFGIPARTIQNWESGKTECNQYILDMMEYKLNNERMLKQEEVSLLEQVRLLEDRVAELEKIVRQ